MVNSEKKMMSGSAIRELTNDEMAHVAGGTVNVSLSGGKLVVSGSSGLGVNVGGVSLTNVKTALGLSGTVKSVLGAL